MDSQEEASRFFQADTILTRPSFLRPFIVRKPLLLICLCVNHKLVYGLVVSQWMEEFTFAFSRCEFSPPTRSSGVQVLCGEYVGGRPVASHSELGCSPYHLGCGPCQGPFWNESLHYLHKDRPLSQGEAFPVYRFHQTWQMSHCWEGNLLCWSFQSLSLPAPALAATLHVNLRCQSQRIFTFSPWAGLDWRLSVLTVFVNWH